MNTMGFIQSHICLIAVVVITLLGLGCASTTTQQVSTETTEELISSKPTSSEKELEKEPPAIEKSQPAENIKPVTDKDEASTTLDQIQQEKPTPQKPQKAPPELAEQSKEERSQKFMNALKKEIEKRLQERLEKQKVQKEKVQDVEDNQELVRQEQSEEQELPEQSSAPQTHEEKEAMKKAEKKLFTEITGLVIDKTISPFGSHFYDKFYMNWDPPDISQDYTIYIHEKSSPSFGFILTIKVDSYNVWGKYLKPRIPEIDKSVEEALGKVKQFIMNYEQMLKQLGGNDMQGDGIM